MSKKLKILYFLLNGLIFTGIIILWKMQKQLGHPYQVMNKWLQVSIAVLSSVLAVIIPIWMRIMAFSVYNKKGKKATETNFWLFERMTIVSASLAFALTPIVYLWNVNLWVRYLVTFIGIYALYFSYPSDKKLVTDIRLFKIKKDEALE